MEVSTKQDLSQFSSELSQELQQLLNYWSSYTPDQVNGGFIGRVSVDNQADEYADKGAVLNARILWSFSAAFNAKAITDIEMADRAYQYIVNHFIDQDFGGVYWTVDYQGNPKDTKKQVYAIAFTIYGLSEYFIASGNEVVKEHAIALYHDLVKYSHDQKRGGYYEAFDREWNALKDLRLSAKDANEAKTMNTHLHVLEAFANLYRIWPDGDLKLLIADLIADFKVHMIDAQSNQLVLFLDENWVKKSDIVSYGHDIEASWLLLEAAEVIAVPDVVEDMKDVAVKMAEATLAGLDKDGALWYEYMASSVHLIKEKHWWVQAEAMVGFFNAWQISADERYLNAALNNWTFIKSRIIDQVRGEWYWGVGEDDKIMDKEDKVGVWKCPYHNSRACLELISRIGGFHDE